jgi:hypothetical protein
MVVESCTLSFFSTSIDKAQWQGITPLQFTGFALAIIALMGLLGLTLT